MADLTDIHDSESAGVDTKIDASTDADIDTSIEVDVGAQSGAFRGRRADDRSADKSAGLPFTPKRQDQPGSANAIPPASPTASSSQDAAQAQFRRQYNTPPRRQRPWASRIEANPLDVRNNGSHFHKDIILAVTPAIVAITGAALVGAYAHSPFIAATATLITAGLTGLSLVPVVNGRSQLMRRIGAMRERFEHLEDRAWELRESEERYRSLAEAFGDLLVLHDPDGRIAYCNGAYAKCFAKSPEELVGNMFERGGKARERQSRLGGAIREIPLSTADGERWFAWLDLPVRDDRLGGAAVLSVARDITAFMHAEQVLEQARGRAVQANRAKSRFLAMASHEMRTPLNGIIGMSALLEGTQLTGEQKSYNDSVKASGQALLALIEDMLDMTMIEAGRFALRQERFEIRSLLNGVMELVSSRAHAKGIGLALFVHPDIATTMEADAGRLRQILINLAGNAIKFTAEGGVAIRCTPSSGPQTGALPDDNATDHQWIRIEVRDTGPGLAETDRKRIFEEFERVDDSLSRKVAGAGLGLAISRAIAGQMGGSLELASSSPDGSVFAIELPVAKCSDNAKFADLASNVAILSSRQVEAGCIADQITAHGGQCAQFSQTGDLIDWLKNQHRDKRKPAVIIDPDALPNATKDIAVIRAAAGKKAVVAVLFEPAERQSLDDWLAAGASAWLVRPVREHSLLAFVSDRPGQEDPRILIREQNTAKASDSDVTAQRAETPRILLAEDNDVNATLVTAILAKADIRAERAHNGAEAVKRYIAARKAGEPFEIVLMDMHMPVMDGIEAVTKIRKAEQGKDSATVYALTADEQGATRKDAETAGIDGFLIKPLDPADLLELVCDR